MSDRSRRLVRLQALRERIRDAAAGAVNAQEQVVRDEASKTDAAREVLTVLLANPDAQLRRVKSAADLELVDGERRAARLDVVAREKALADAEAEASRRRTVLHAKERDLRTTERLLERERASIAADGRRTEQKSADDLSAARSVKP